mmetsp:Transcript_46000/g.75030  ORF Transcript_46000/g.75030 Transcript_46000/m.75030 type:complete len:438 (+) Transcript_46000:83-1396(+)
MRSEDPPWPMSASAGKTFLPQCTLGSHTCDFEDAFDAYLAESDVSDVYRQFPLNSGKGVQLSDEWMTGGIESWEPYASNTSILDGIRPHDTFSHELRPEPPASFDASQQHRPGLGVNHSLLQVLDSWTDIYFPHSRPVSYSFKHPSPSSLTSHWLPNDMHLLSSPSLFDGAGFISTNSPYYQYPPPSPPSDVSSPCSSSTPAHLQSTSARADRICITSNNFSRPRWEGEHMNGVDAGAGPTTLESHGTQTAPPRPYNIASSSCSHRQSNYKPSHSNSHSHSHEYSHSPVLPVFPCNSEDLTRLAYHLPAGDTSPFTIAGPPRSPIDAPGSGSDPDWDDDDRQTSTNSVAYVPDTISPRSPRKSIVKYKDRSHAARALVRAHPIYCSNRERYLRGVTSKNLASGRWIEIAEELGIDLSLHVRAKCSSTRGGRFGKKVR